MAKKVKFTNVNKSTFYATVRKRVDTYFIDNALSTHASPAMWFKAAFFLSILSGTYFLILFGGFNLYIKLILGIILVCRAPL